jgi:hypothetical protein
MTIAIQPMTSPAKNAKTNAPYVATSFSIYYQSANPFPRFFDATGLPLPTGVIPFVPAAGETAAALQAAETTDLAVAITNTPGLANETIQAHVDRACTATIVRTRGVTLA